MTPASGLDQWPRSPEEIAYERFYARAALKYFAECERVKLFEERFGGVPDDDRRAALARQREDARDMWYSACAEVQHLEALALAADAKLDGALRRPGQAGVKMALAELELAVAALRHCEIAMMNRQARDKAMVAEFKRAKGRWG